MTGIMDTVEMPKLPENQKSFAGIPEAVFLVSKTSPSAHRKTLQDICTHNLTKRCHLRQQQNVWKKKKILMKNRVSTNYKGINHPHKKKY